MRMLLALGLGSGLVIATPALAQNFSVSAFQPDTIGGFPPGDDILGPGFPPTPVLPGGLVAPIPTSEVNAFSAGRLSGLPLTPSFQFSVDGAAAGAAGTAADAQALAGEAQTDVFHSFGGGFNTLFHDGDGSTASPGGPLGLSEGPPFGTSFFGVDAYEQNPPGSFPGPVYWSVDAVTATANPVYAGLLPGDVFISPPAPGYAAGPAVFATAASLGLGASDDIDALEVYDFGTVGVFDPADLILFSLTPGSALVGGGFATPGDIYASSGAGSFGLFAPDVALGLAPGDNVNALSVVPEPGSLALLALGGVGLLGRRRRAAAA